MTSNPNNRIAITALAASLLLPSCTIYPVVGAYYIDHPQGSPAIASTVSVGDVLIESKSDFADSASAGEVISTNETAYMVVDTVTGSKISTLANGVTTGSITSSHNASESEVAEVEVHSEAEMMITGSIDPTTSSAETTAPEAQTVTAVEVPQYDYRMLSEIILFDDIGGGGTFSTGSIGEIRGTPMITGTPMTKPQAEPDNSTWDLRLEMLSNAN